MDALDLEKAVDVHGRLAHEGASRPLLGENLHAEAVVIEIITRSGEFGAAWGEVDVNHAVDLQGEGFV